jgi:hypothetical protein
MVFCNRLLLLWTHEVMACQAVSGTSSLRDALKAGSLMPAEDSGPEEDLSDGLELHPPWVRDFLDAIPGGGGDAEVF